MVSPEPKTGREFEFSPEYDGTLPLETAVYQAMGAASMSWVDGPCGEFDSAWALEVGQKLIDYINEREQRRAKA